VRQVGYLPELSTQCFVTIAPPSKCEMEHTHARLHTHKHTQKV